MLAARKLVPYSVCGLGCELFATERQTSPCRTSVNGPVKSTERIALSEVASNHGIPVAGGSPLEALRDGRARGPMAIALTS